MTDTGELDPRALRNAFGCFATGVTVVTTISRSGDPIGTTMNSFSSVSLDPPLVLFALDLSSEHFDDFIASDRFAVNVLSADQQDLSNRFATPGRAPIDAADFSTWDTGCPILNGALTSFDCRAEQQYEGGDHVIFLCRVVRIGDASDDTPLAYFRGGYAQVQS